MRDSIIMKDTIIGENCKVDKAIIAENCEVGDEVEIGVGEEAPSKLNAEDLCIRSSYDRREFRTYHQKLKIGKNTAISGVTDNEDYPDGILAERRIYY